MENYIIGGICNICDSLTKLRIESNFNIPIGKYINSGVLLFNTKEFILNRTKNECLRLIKILSKDILTCPDQDIINIACQNKIKLLDDVWNFQWHHQWDEDNRKIDAYVRRFEKAKKNIEFYILHLELNHGKILINLWHGISGNLHVCHQYMKKYYMRI